MASDENKKNWVDFREIKAKVGIKDILAHYGLLEGLKEKGDELVGLCPFHKESKGSFRANLTKNAFHCFGCGAKGNVLDFVSLKEKINIREAGLLTQGWFRLGSEGSQKAPGEPKKSKAIENPIQEKKEQNEADIGDNEINFPLTFVLKNLDYNHPYLFERGLSKEAIEYFGMGFCSKGLMKDRIVIPIHNQKGELVAYAGRWPGDPPESEGKYKLPPKFSKSAVVFNLHRAKEFADKGLILVEGYFDVFKLWQAGFSNAVALMGSQMSKEQEELIIETIGSNGRVILLFDNDEAGIKCQQDVLERLAKKCFVKVSSLPEGIRQVDEMEVEKIKVLLK
jgi:DNA primase